MGLSCEGQRGRNGGRISELAGIVGMFLPLRSESDLGL